MKFVLTSFILSLVLLSQSAFCNELQKLCSKLSATTFELEAIAMNLWAEEAVPTSII